ncbi:hypothetical protein EDB89DRAFT_1915664 [Lactarius sanguifluus]|nr:hypothetical protein EDB89DRAFT_1915664 [Lactarius sanguifluus]
MWRGLGVCWVGVAVSWRVAGCCAPCRGGVGAGRGWALRATLKGRGGSAGSWHVLGRGGGESVGGGVLRAVLGWRGGRWRLGLACRVEAAWRVGGVLACRVGSARWVGGGGVAGQDGGGSRARMGCNLQGLAPCWGGEVLRRVGAVRWVGGGGVLEQDGGGSRARMAVLRAMLGAAGWWWWRVASHVGAACWGRDEWKRLACTRGRQWPATLKVR